MQICRGGSELDPTTEEDWYWLRKPAPGVLLLQPPITTGPLSAPLGSTAATLSTAPTDYTGANLSVANWFLKVGTHADIFRVSAHTSGSTALTLDGAFTGTTVIGSDYTLFLIDY